MLVTIASLRDGSGLWDIETIDGKIASVTENSSGTPAGSNSYDAQGRLAIPQFCENHIHLDYANTAGTPRDNQSGTLFEAIETWAEHPELVALKALLEVKQLATMLSQTAHSRSNPKQCA
ncbi:hypothetical protein LTS14_006528 [Recurvomyces mirabilis]|uniref:uncharacterized protein n=1 Tax=Recurvomyces mirabilis TaxID=574656 RepID=UPI002DDF8C18|nr:hypothetical protein LTS14_006528 [Recurvomyces mirabilis]